MSRASAEQQACFHCGLPVAEPQRWTINIDNKVESLCCPGCQAVANTIIAGGFEQYYQRRTALADRPEETASAYAAYDDPLVQQSFVQVLESETAETVCVAQLLIEGIHCAACCWLIEEALKRHAGVESATVNASSHRASISWRRDTVSLSQLMELIRQVGYVPQPYHRDTEQQMLEQEHSSYLMRLGVAGIVMMQAMMFSVALYSGDFAGMDVDHRNYLHLFGLLMILPVVLYSALPFYKGALRSLRAGQPGMDVPVSIALLSAFAASCHTVLQAEGEVYFDSISMFVFLLLLARFAELRVRRHFFVGQLSSLLPPSCEYWDEEAATYCNVPVSQVQPGSKVIIKPGESVGLDARVLEGKSSIDESAFNGEQYPVDKGVGDTVYAGTVNGDGVLVAEVLHASGQSRMDTVARLGEQGQGNCAATVKLADRIARYFVSGVLLLAAITAVYWYTHAPEQAFPVVLAVLVVSCPCALSLATPAALAFSQLALRTKGLLICDSDCVDDIKTIDTVIFDKTGTLTRGELKISRVLLASSLPDQLQQQDLLELAAAMEKYSSHPVANAFADISTDLQLQNVSVHTGRGISASDANNSSYRLGSEAFCQSGFSASSVQQDAVTVFDLDRADSGELTLTQKIYLSDDRQWLACFILSDELRDQAASTVEFFRNQNMELAVLSGDHSGSAEQLARVLRISHCLSGKSPEQKLDYIQALQQKGHRVMMVGDGINDIPVMAQADISIAMNSASDLAKVKASAVLLRDSLAPLAVCFRHFAKTRMVIQQNLFWALLYNSISLPAAALGLVPPWLAAIGMSGSSLLVTFNSMRLRKPD